MSLHLHEINRSVKYIVQAKHLNPDDRWEAVGMAFETYDLAHDRERLEKPKHFKTRILMKTIVDDVVTQVGLTPP